MGVDVRNFVVDQADYSGLDRAANTVMRQKEFEQTNQLRQDARQAASTNNLNNFFDQRDYLTGTDYDPIIVQKIDAALQKGYQLTSQGMSNSDVFMALGKDVSDINEYSQKAKRASANLKKGVAILKQQGGYLTDKIEKDAAQKMFFNEDGTQKDIRDVDPNEDWISKTVVGNEENYTNSEGLDKLLKNMELSKSDFKNTRSNAGVSTTDNFTVNAYPHQAPLRDADGNLVTDKDGNAKLGVSGYWTPKDKNGKSFRVMDRDRFDVMMARGGSGFADHVTGMINQLARQLGKPIPERNTDEWSLMGQKVLHDELEMRGGGSISKVDKVVNKDFVDRRQAGVPLWKPPTTDAAPVKGLLNRKK
jgi:hypothetical protein